MAMNECRDFRGLGPQKKTVKAALGAFTVPEMHSSRARAFCGGWFALRNNGG
jgi:hypothetical protein